MAIAAVKCIHTVIFACISACVLYVFAVGVLGRPSRRTGVAAAMVVAEMAVFAGNHWRCPLTALAERLGAESGRVTDIYLPRWFADRIPQIYTPIFLVGLLSMLWRYLAQRGASVRTAPVARWRAEEAPDASSHR